MSKKKNFYFCMISGRVAFLIAVVCIFTFVGLSANTLIKRYIYGVKPGVMLEDRIVQGKLAGELARIVNELAKEREEMPVNARFDNETDTILPHQYGIKIDRIATIKKVMGAKENQKISLVLKKVKPEITKDYFEPIRRGNPEKKEVAFLINVAWGEDYLPGMLDVLRKHKVKATFSFVADWVEKFPTLSKQVALDGHEIANHSYNHPHPTHLSKEQMKSNIKRAEDVIKETTGYKTKLFGPPYGEYDQNTVIGAAELGYRTILWTVDTVDWKLPGVDWMANRVVSKADNGMIVLMHPTKQTAQVLEAIIPGLRDKGYKIVTVSRVLD